jgi:hypothetical protein
VAQFYPSRDTKRAEKHAPEDEPAVVPVERDDVEGVPVPWAGPEHGSATRSMSCEATSGVGGHELEDEPNAVPEEEKKAPRASAPWAERRQVVVEVALVATARKGEAPAAAASTIAKVPGDWSNGSASAARPGGGRERGGE